MCDNYYKLSPLSFYLDYFNPQINYLGFAQIILKLSPMCEAFANIYCGLQLLAGQNYKLSPICEAFPDVYRGLHLLAGHNYTKKQNILTAKQAST